MGRIRVLIVDDSAFMRHSVGRLLGEESSIEVVGAAANGVEGLDMVRALRPDVVTLDVEMPVLDGLGMLQRLMIESPTRVVMLSSLTTNGARITLDALDCGAIDFVPKPSGSLSIDVGRVRGELVAKIQAAAGMSEASFQRHRMVAAVNVARMASRDATRSAASGKSAAPAQPPACANLSPRGVGSMPRLAARRLVVIASSTGGPGALTTVVGGLPRRLGAAVVIVQHMPPGFTASLAGRLDQLGTLPCREALADDLLAEDTIHVAPGDKHLICSTIGHVRLVQLPAVNGVRPAADVTLQAVAPLYASRMLCVVLTGMGCDGRDGARAVKAHGGTVYAQDEASSTIYGMPAAVAEAGLTDRVLPLSDVASAIAEWSSAPSGDDRRLPSTTPGAARASSSTGAAGRA